MSELVSCALLKGIREMKLPPSSSIDFATTRFEDFVASGFMSQETVDRIFAGTGASFHAPLKDGDTLFGIPIRIVPDVDFAESVQPDFCRECGAYWDCEHR